MRRIILGLILMCVVPLLIAAQENELKISTEVAPFAENASDN